MNFISKKLRHTQGRIHTRGWGRSPKKFFWPSGPHFGRKIRGRGRPPDPLPWIRHWYLLESKGEGQRYTARESWECSVCLWSRVKSKLEGSKTSFTAFTVYILYYLLIFKYIFSLDPRPGFRKPQGFFGLWFLLPFDHFRHLNPEYPRPAGGSPLCKILGKNQESSCRLLRRNRQSWIFPMRIRLF